MRKENLDIQKICEMILMSSRTVWGMTSIKKETGKSYIAQMIADELNVIGKSVLYFSIGNKVANIDYSEIGDMKVAIKEDEGANVRKNVCISDLEKINAIVYGAEFDDLLSMYKANYDYVIVDVKALDESSFSQWVCKKCDENLVVISKSSENGILAGEKIAQLQKAGVKVSGVILNEYTNKKSILRM